MRKGQLPALLKLLNAGIPEFRLSGRMLYANPSSHILAGFYFESRDIPDSVYIWSFIQPLYVPQAHISFQYGHRIRNGKAQQIHELLAGDNPASLIAEFGNERSSFLSAAASLVNWDENIDQFINMQNPGLRQLECKYYTQIIIDKMKESAVTFGRLQAQYEISRGQNAGWTEKIMHRAHQVEIACRDSAEAAKNIILSWEPITASALGI